MRNRCFALIGTCHACFHAAETRLTYFQAAFGLSNKHDRLLAKQEIQFEQAFQFEPNTCNNNRQPESHKRQRSKNRFQAALF